MTVVSYIILRNFKLTFKNFNLVKIRSATKYGWIQILELCNISLIHSVLFV